MPRLEDATKKPSNIGEIIPPATPTAQQVPPIIPREQPGLGPASLGPAPSLWTTGYDSVRQWARPGTSQGRFPTLPTKANPQLNAAARSVTTTIIKNSPAPAFTGVTSVGLSLPRELTVSGSPVTSSGVLAASWVTEPAGTFFQAAPPSLSGIQGINTATGTGTGTTISTTPTTASSFAIYCEFSNNSTTSSLGGGWTEILRDSSSNIDYKSFSTISPITAAQTLAASTTWAAAIAVFTGPIPTVVQSRTAAITPTGGTVSFSSSNTAGNTLVVIMQTYNSGKTLSLSMSDSNGNAYTQLVNQAVSGSGIVVQQAMFVAPNCAGGANAITWSNVGDFNPAYGNDITIIEWGPFPSGAGIPAFLPLTSGQIPPIHLGSSGNGGVSGILGVTNGGTSSNLSATGGVSKFLSQASPGAVITVVRPDFSDLAGAAGQPATSYNGTPLVSNGIPSEVATVDLTAQAAAKATTTLYAVPATGAGQYRLLWNAKVTTVDATSSTLGPLTITYTDPDGVVQTIAAAAQSKAGVIETSDTGNLTTTVLLGLNMMLNCKASTNIQYAMAYASNVAGTMKYNLHIKLEAL